MAENMIKVTDQTFGDTISTSTPVLVDFWAEWCGPCRMIAPILEEISTEYAGKIQIAKLNVDENPQTAMQYDVMSIPTMIVYSGGAERKRIVGARPKAAMLSELSEFLN
jgi:thioredoxin 1